MTLTKRDPTKRDPTKRDPKNAYWPLVVGLAFVGAAIGFVIGASETPVAGVVVGPLLALIPVGLEVLKARSNRDRSIAIQKVADSAAPDDARRQLAASLGDAPAPVASAAQLGVGLIFVAIGFLGGTVVGGLARVRHWYEQAAAAPAPLPWDANMPKDCVLTAESMADFITMRRGLMDAGFSAAQTNRIFELGKDRWCKPMSAGSPPVTPAPPPPFPWSGMAIPQAKGCVVNREGAIEFLALRDQFVRAGYPPSSADEIFRLSPGDWCPSGTIVTGPHSMKPTAPGMSTAVPPAVPAAVPSPPPPLPVPPPANKPKAGPPLPPPGT